MSFAQMKYPNHDSKYGIHLSVIKEIKQFLISRDHKNKMKAVKTILKKVTTTESRGLIGQLINEDIVELLCETSCTTDLFLLQMIFKCILKFIENKKFFEQHHTTFTCEYIIRSLQVLLKIDEDRETLTYGLQVVSLLIYRVKTLNISLNEVCNVPNVVNLLKQIYTPNEHSPVIFVATEVILNVLQSKGIICLKEILIEITSQALQFLADKLTKEKTEESIIVISELVTNAMRYLLQKDDYSSSNQSEQNLLVQLIMILKELLVPILMESNICENDFNLVNSILNCVLSIYYSPDENISVEFSEFLVSRGILNFLSHTEVKGFADMTVTRSILYEILVYLSFHHLGYENWKYLLSLGLEKLPVNASLNNIFIKGRDTVLPIASIIYNYFYLITCSNPVVDLDFLHNICQFVLFLENKPSNPILKALWFDFTVAYLCVGDDYPQSKVPMNKLIQFLMNSDIKSIYTHHPAILYWVFCDSAIPQDLQTQVIIFWTDYDDQQSISELYSVMKTNIDSCLLILEIMSLCDRKISYRLQNILSLIIQEHGIGSKYLYEHAWSLLPTCLAKYSSNPESLCYESLANLMKHCVDYIPKSVDQLITRISCLLPGAFSKYFLISWQCHTKESFVLNNEEESTVVNTINLSSCLLNAGNENQDKRVTVSFLGREDFLNAIEYFLGANNENITQAVMNLLTLLIVNQKKLNFWATKVIQLEGSKIIKFLQGEAKLSIIVLKFLAQYLEILSENSGSPVVHIPLPSALQLRALYLHIHMICAKSDSNTARWCWCCLRRLLLLSESMELQEHLAMLPFTPQLLLKTSESAAWEEAVKFFSVWLKLLPTYSPRSLSTPMSLKVVQHFSSKIEKSKLSKELMDSLKKVALLGHTVEANE